MIRWIGLLGIFLVGSCKECVNAKAANVFVPDIAEGLKYPSTVACLSNKEKNETIHIYRTSTSPDDTNSLSCRLYMAPSTIPGAGMGVFAGQSFNKGDVVGEPDTNVLFIDMKWNNDVQTQMFEKKFLWDEYNYYPEKIMREPGIEAEVGALGIGSLANSFLPLVNVNRPGIDYDNAGLEPGIDPGSGAFTVYHNQRNSASKDITSGEEIFIDYGMGYFFNRKHIYGLMPFNMHFDRADALLNAFRNVVQTAIGRKEMNSGTEEIEISEVEKVIRSLPSKDQNALSEAEIKELLQEYQSLMQEKKSKNLLKRNSSVEPCNSKELDDERVATDLFTLMKLVMNIWPSRNANAMPESYADANHVMDTFGSTRFNHAERSKRDLEWLQLHGSCIDNLVIGNSTIPHAGRGVFANKFLPEGSVVAPVPLIHLPEREVFNMYSGYVTSNAGEYKRNETDLIHHQLILNYCFGHRASSLLLCPYGVASALVNHGSSKKDQANVKIVWSNKATSRPEWFDMPLREWAYHYKAGLAFDYVAICDIHEGEEVLVDYGDEWQAAWDKHVQTWTPKPFMSQILNEQDPPVDIPSSDKWPWPDVHLWCRNVYRGFQGLPWAENDVYPCHVISKTVDSENKEILYTAEVIMRFYGTKEDYTEEYSDRPDLAPEPDNFCSEAFDEILFDLPRDAFIFGGSFHVDEHIRYDRETWSFRHDLRIPDDIMPEKWKNQEIV